MVVLVRGAVCVNATSFCSTVVVGARSSSSPCLPRLVQQQKPPPPTPPTGATRPHSAVRKAQTTLKKRDISVSSFAAASGAKKQK